MRFWIRASCAMAVTFALTANALPPVMAQTSPRILPERKPDIPERAKSTPAPEVPRAAKVPILPERKPPIPDRKGPTTSTITQAAPSAESITGVRLGTRIEPTALTPRDRELFAQAIQSAASSRWASARESVRRIGNPVLVNVIEWIAMRSPGAQIDFNERTAFIEAHPDWPSMGELKRITEDVADDSGGPAERLSWFAKNPPATTAGKVAFAEAALSARDMPLAEKLAREAWLTGRFDGGEERDFLKTFSRFIRPEDHRARLEELLYAEQRSAADRMLKRVDTPMAAIASVRMALIASAGNVERLISKLPGDLAADPGLVYDRIKWRRKRDREDAARELLPNLVDTAPRPDLWWRERQFLARDSLEKSRAREAYTIVKNHGTLDAVNLSEAEWLAGWIALRFLNDGEAALQHFQKVYDTVQLAANVSRGAYWTGRAAEQLGRPDIAADWYRKAATHITTFYGQLGLGRLKNPTLPQLPLDPTPSAQERAAFDNKDMTKAVRALADVPGTPFLRQFVLALADSSDFAVDRHMAAELAHRLGHPDLGVWVARQAGRDRIIIVTYGYPIPAFKFPAAPEKALMLAIMRQESNFDTDAASPTGALGLMQLMPATARATARTSGQSYNKPQLNSDPAYNVRLGGAYLNSLVEEFEGSYIMAAAGYNAGPGRPKQWARTFGDPRLASVDAVDWVESIPFPETRNYVQRVMENVMVYRTLLANSTSVPQSLEKELKVATPK